MRLEGFSRRNKIVIKTSPKSSACTSRIREGPSIFHKLPAARKPVTQDRKPQQTSQAPTSKSESLEIVDVKDAPNPKGDKKREAEENKDDHLPAKPVTVCVAMKKRRINPRNPPKLILRGVGPSMYSKEYELCGCAQENLLRCHRCKLLRLVEKYVWFHREIEWSKLKLCCKLL